MVVYILFVVFITLGVAYYASGHNIARALNLASTQTSESFTELYFTNPGQLPAYAAPGKRQTVHFRIVNDSPAQQTYRYTVSVTVNQHTNTYTSKSMVKPGAGVSIPFSYTIPQSGEQALITVNLLGTHEQLVLRSHS